MARGENQRASGNPIGAAILAVFAACALAALAFVVVTTRACTSCEAALFGAMATSDPYVGASTAAAELGWRDAGRARAAWGAPVPADPVAAAAHLEAVLIARGYVASTTLVVPAGRELPTEFDVPELAGGCGVVEIIGENGARIDSARANGVEVAASDPSVVGIGTCDGGAVAVVGLGRVTARVWHLPGLVPGDVYATSIPADVLLAHAEAEHVLARYGYVATNDVVRIELTGGAGLVSPLPLPSSGCVPWVVVATGAGSSISGTMTDRAVDRTLALAVTCATRAGWDVSTTPATAGGTAWARAFRPPGSGASLPGDAPTTVGAARIIDANDVVLPSGLPEAP